MTGLTSTCGCPLHESGNGDVRCHKCGEYVNRRCWQCKTVRGDGPCPNPRSAPPAEPTDDDRAKAIVAMSKAIESDRLTIGHAISLVAQLLADQRAAIHASYEVVAKAQRESCEQWWQEANGAEEPDLSYARGRQHAADQAAYAIRKVASK